MKRIEIHGGDSTQRFRPHVMDAIVDGANIYLEVKYRRIRERVLLSHVLQQIREVTPIRCSGRT